MRKLVALLTVALVLAAVNWRIAGSERVLREGQMFYLELAPVDPRSLLQGDYMALNYAVSLDLQHLPGGLVDGWVVLQLGPDQVARQPQLVSDPALARPGQVALRYERDRWRLRVGSDAYFFEEGQGARYSVARYGIFRSDGAGHALLTGLADAAFKPL